jgi:ankyrin repeat protein
VLIRAGADVNQAKTDEEYGNSPLIAACTHNHPLVADALLQAGARVGFVRKDGATALYMACQDGHIECVRVLIRAGADVNQACADEKYGDSPLIMASQEGHVHVVDALIAAGCQLNYARPSDGCTALIMASQDGFVDVVRSLLAAGADPRIAMHNGRTALDFAKHFKHPSVAALLEAKLAELAGGSK